jgi:uncharacterized protein YbjT (DUF2867 family)
MRGPPALARRRGRCPLHRTDAADDPSYGRFRGGYNAKETGYGPLHHGVRRNRLHRPPSGGAAASRWRDGAHRRAHPDRYLVGTESAPEIVQADVLDDTGVSGAIAGADAVINLVGILTETARQTYRAIHVEGARRVALAAHRHGVTRVIHVSALSASPKSPAISDQTKAEGEQAVRAAFPQATIVRPSLVFGEDDHFFTRFRRHDQKQSGPAADRRGHDEVPAGLRR